MIALASISERVVNSGPPGQFRIWDFGPPGTQYSWDVQQWVFGYRKGALAADPPAPLTSSNMRLQVSFNGAPIYDEEFLNTPPDTRTQILQNLDRGLVVAPRQNIRFQPTIYPMSTGFYYLTVNVYGDLRPNYQR